MKSRTGLVLSLTILSILFSMGSLQANEVAEKATITASGAWLSLVERGDYAESWNQAAGLALKIPNIQGYA
jgi:hypothetical protein